MVDPDTEVDWPLVWSQVSTTVAGHLTAGRGHLVTRDTVRLGTVLALQAAGVVPSRMALDLPTPGAPARPALADLLVDGPGGTAIDLRLPWDTDGQDTHTMGVLLSSLLRIGAVPARRRWVLQVLGSERMGHLESAAARRGLVWPSRPGVRVLLDQAALDGLPPGAGRVLAGVRWQLPVVVACAGVWPVSPDLALYVFDVSAPLAGEETSTGRAEGAARPTVVREESPARSEQALEPPPAVAAPSPRGTARAEVLEAVRALAARTGREVVEVDDVLAEVRRGGSRFADSTVVTMLTRHMCVQVQGRGVASYDDVEQVDATRYRLRPGR